MFGKFANNLKFIYFQSIASNNKIHPLTKKKKTEPKFVDIRLGALKNRQVNKSILELCLLFSLHKASQNLPFSFI